MTNYEYYKDELIRISIAGHALAVHKNKPTMCFDTRCCDCDFFTAGHDCRSRRTEWFDEEYKEPKLAVDWSKVPKDTKIIVNDERKYFAKYVEVGRIYFYPKGKTSWSSRETEVACCYEREAELAEPHPEWMKEVKE